MEKLQKKAQIMVEESTGKNKLDAINLEMTIINNIFHLETDGIYPLVKKIEELEAENNIEESENNVEDAEDW